MPNADASVLLFIGDDYEDLELWYPLLRLREAGYACTVAGLDAAGTKYKGKHGYPCISDAGVSQVRSADYAAIVIPGGWMPDKLRRNADVLRLTREFAEAGKLVATICHGPWIMISAGVCRGRKMTSTPGIKDDLTNAGAEWQDSAVVTDGNLISSRRPADLPEFMAAVVGWLKASR